jgi:hypothetical protein
MKFKRLMVCFGLWGLTPLSTIFHLHRFIQYCIKKSGRISQPILAILLNLVYRVAPKDCQIVLAFNLLRGRRGRDRMVVEFTTTCVISADHH